MNSERNPFSQLQKQLPVKSLIQFGIIAATILLSLGAAYWGTSRIQILLISLVVGAGGLATLVSFPQLGFLLIMVAGMFIPFSGPGGVNASILSVILLLALWLIDMFVVKREFHFVRSRTLRPVAFFMVISILAFVLGQIPWFMFANQAPLNAQIGGFAIYFLLLASMIMMANLVKDVRWLKAFIWGFAALAYLYVIAGCLLELPFMDQLYQHGVYANSIFWMLLISLPLSQAIFNNHLGTGNRLLLYGLVAVALYVAVIQRYDWKSGWVPAVVAAGVLAAVRFRRLVPFAIPVVAAIAIYLSKDLISTDLYSWGTRLDAWMIVLQISQVSPIIGMGFANYSWYAPLFPIRGYAIQFNSHSQFVDIIAQTGVLGLFCFLWLLFEVGRLAWRLGEKLPDGFARAYARGVFASVFGAIIAAFLVDWLLPYAYNIGMEGVRGSVLLWLLWGGLVSIEQIYFGRPEMEVGVVYGENG